MIHSQETTIKEENHVEPSAAEFVQSSASGIFPAAGAAIKAFVLANPVALAGIAGIVIGVLGYRILAHGDHDNAHEPEEVSAS